MQAKAAPPRAALIPHPFGGRDLGVVALVGLSFLSLFLLDRLGPAAVLAFLISSALLLYPLRSDAFQIIRRFALLLTFPLLTVASVLWSDNPQDSFRYGIQLVLTTVSALTIATRLPLRNLGSALLVSSLLLCLGSLVYAARGADGSLIGLMGSKNSMASIGAILLISSTEALFDTRQQRLIRWISPLGALLGAYVLLVSHSAGAVAGAAVSVMVFFAISFVGWLPPRGRAFVLISVILMLVLGVYAAINGVSPHLEVVERALGKDATLTGRTYLWGRAWSFIAARPWLGHGYSAFWIQGSMDAEGLWRYAGINTRSGFNFHNSYIETGVDLGWTGMLLLIIIVAMASMITLWKLAWRPSLPGAFVAALLSEIVVRSFTETLLYRQLNYFSFLFIICAAYMFKLTLPPRAGVARPGGRGVRLWRPRGPLPAPPRVQQDDWSWPSLRPTSTLHALLERS